MKKLSARVSFIALVLLSALSWGGVRLAKKYNANNAPVSSQSKEGPFYIRKNVEHPRLVQLSKLAENVGCFPFLPPAPQIERGFGRVALPKGKVEQKYGHQLTQKWRCEG